MSDTPSRPVRPHVSCATNPDGAPSDMSRNASLLVPPPIRVNICRAATPRRPCMRSISNGDFQLHRGRHRRPPWRFAPIRLEAPASDWRLGTSRGCSSHVALAPRTLPPALDAPTQGLASILVARCAVAAPPSREGVRSCPSVDVGRRYCACSTGTLAPGRAGVVRPSLWGLAPPNPCQAASGV
jgi:hypothetical protein